MEKIYCFSTKGMNDMNLTDSRQQIDEIDKQITVLLEERMKVVAAVAAYKKAHRMPVLDKTREAAVLDKVAVFTSDKLLVPYIKRIYQALMDESKAYEADEMKRNG